MTKRELVKTVERLHRRLQSVENQMNEEYTKNPSYTRLMNSPFYVSSFRLPNKYEPTLKAKVDAIIEHFKLDITVSEDKHIDPAVQLTVIKKAKK